MRYVQALALSLAVVILSGCSTAPGDQALPANDDDISIQVGGLYTSERDDGKWRVSKVLAYDGDTVHVRMYANKFAERPQSLDPAILTLGSVGSPNGFGIGHAPIARQGFLSEKQYLVMVTPVTSDELEGYRYYLEAMRDAR
jgi:hypothetical protein